MVLIVLWLVLVTNDVRQHHFRKQKIYLGYLSFWYMHRNRWSLQKCTGNKQDALFFAMNNYTGTPKHHERVWAIIGFIVAVVLAVALCVGQEKQVCRGARVTDGYTYPIKWDKGDRPVTLTSNEVGKSNSQCYSYLTSPKCNLTARYWFVLAFYFRFEFWYVGYRLLFSCPYK